MAMLTKIALFMIKYRAYFRLVYVFYVACLSPKPEVVVETSVGYVFTYVFFLKALQANKKGKQNRVYMLPLRREAYVYVGYFVPDSFKYR